MKLITINPNNEPYYSEDFIKGFECGAQRQLEADKADRPQGEWLNYKDEHTCSICKEVVIDDWYYEYEWYDFCPHCGARMKGADDGE